MEQQSETVKKRGRPRKNKKQDKVDIKNVEVRDIPSIKPLGDSKISPNQEFPLPEKNNERNLEQTPSSPKKKKANNNMSRNMVEDSDGEALLETACDQQPQPSKPEVVKRPRGRPRKIKTDDITTSASVGSGDKNNVTSVLQSVEAANCTKPDIILQKPKNAGRGRPRKIRIDDITTNAGVKSAKPDTILQTKHAGRGRPRKIKKDEINTKAAVGSAALKKDATSVLQKNVGIAVDKGAKKKRIKAVVSTKVKKNSSGRSLGDVNVKKRKKETDVEVSKTDFGEKIEKKAANIFELNFKDPDSYESNSPVRIEKTDESSGCETPTLPIIGQVTPVMKATDTSDDSQEFLIKRNPEVNTASHRYQLRRSNASG